MILIRAGKKRGVDGDAWAIIAKWPVYINKLLPIEWLAWSLGLRDKAGLEWVEEANRLHSAIDAMYEKYGTGLGPATR